MPSLLILLLAVSGLQAQSGPYVPGRILVTHAATGAEPTSADSGLAPGSLADVNLLGITADLAAAGAENVELRLLAPSLIGERLLEPLQVLRRPDGSVTEYRIRIPVDATEGAGELRVVARDRTFTAPLFIRTVNFGIFRNAKYGARQADTAATLVQPAVPGGVVTLSGTGLGKLQRFNQPSLRVRVAGQLAEIVDSGAVEERPGVERIRFRVPPGIKPDCYVPVEVEVADKLANPVTIPIGSGAGSCPHPLHLSDQELSRLDAGAALPVVTLTLSAFAGPDSGSLPWAPPYVLYKRWDWVGMSILNLDAGGVARLVPDPVAEGCRASLQDAGAVFGAFIQVSPIDGSAAAAPTLTGPGFAPRQLTGAGGFFRDMVQESPALPGGVLPATILTEGEWTFAREQTSAVAAIQKTFRTPEPLRLRDRFRLSRVRRAEDFVVEWTGGDPALDTVTVRIDVTREGQSYQATCGARAGKGSVTVPKEILARIPAGWTDGPAHVHIGLHRDRNSLSLFRIPLTGGSEAIGVFTYSYTDAIAARLD